MATLTSVDDALKKYEVDKPEKERAKREQETLERLKREQEDLERSNRKTIEEKAAETKRIAYASKLEADNPAGIIFDTICQLVESDDAVQTNILNSIAETGSTKIELVTSDWNLGLRYHYGARVNLSNILSTNGSTYSSSTIIDQFNSRKNYRYVVKNEKFKDWTISSSTYYGVGFVFIMILPDLRLKITLQPPASSFMRFVGSLFSS